MFGACSLLDVFRLPRLPNLHITTDDEMDNQRCEGCPNRMGFGSLETGELEILRSAARS